MRNTKRVISNFDYRECDAFAEYLHRQSLQGWHFKEWKLGLVFEKGEPKDITYTVEVFPKGSEMDLRPGENVQEYAEFCARAGWKLLDSQRKFCIFKQINENVVSIVEPEERLQNIKKAEWQNWRETSIVGLGFIALYLYQFWKFDFEEWIFSNFMLLVLVLMVITALCRIADVVLLKIWEKRKKREIEQGEALFFGKCKSMTIFRRYFFYLCIVGMILNVENIEQGKILLATGMLLLFLILLNVFLSFWRPLEIDNGAVQFFATMFILVALGIFVRQGIEEKPERNVSHSIFGFSVEGGYQEDFYVNYKVYHSETEWILNKIWTEFDIEEKETVKCNEEWGADEAHRIGGEGTYFYYIRYPQYAVRLYVDGKTELTQKEVQDIRDKLELPE